MTIDTKIRTEPATTDADLLWQRFLDARCVAMKSLKIADAMAAGHAWAEFLAVFVVSPPIVPGQPQ